MPAHPNIAWPEPAIPRSWHRVHLSWRWNHRRKGNFQKWPNLSLPQSHLPVTHGSWKENWWSPQGNTFEKPRGLVRAGPWQQMGHISRRWGDFWPEGWPCVSCLRVYGSLHTGIAFRAGLESQPWVWLLWPQNTEFWFSSKTKKNKTCTLALFSCSSIPSILAILVKWANSCFRELRSLFQPGKTSDYLESSVPPCRAESFCSIYGS